MNYTATYSPDDNKLRLYSVGRLPADVYARVKAAGFKWAPKQDLFFAPMWTPGREDLLIELAGEIGDEDTSLADRAEQRAERFDEYSEKRAGDAERAREAVAAIADNIPLGQPILIGHHSEKHARKDAERIENGMRRAVKMWETSKYWTDRAAGALAHAKYKERPDVRARRIKTIEADARKQERVVRESTALLTAWRDPAAVLRKKDGSAPTLRELVIFLGNRDGGYYRSMYKRASGYEGPISLWEAAGGNIDEKDPEAVAIATPEEICAQAVRNHEGRIKQAQRWLDHYNNRLAYERAMLADAGGTVAQQNGPMKGGACKCWASPRGGWSYIQKVNKVSVTVLDNWGNAGDKDGSRNFTRTIPFDKLADIMSPLEVDNARQGGQLIETDDKTGFILLDRGPTVNGEQFPKGYTPEAARYEQSTRDNVCPDGPTCPDTECKDERKRQGLPVAEFEAMRESLRQGVQVVSAPQLFPTPDHLAERMAQLAEIEAGQSVLEPSAGTGQLLKAVQALGFNGAVKLHACELNLKLSDTLAHKFQGVPIYPGDFLERTAWELGAPFDRIVMNPPFENGADIKHIQHALAMLKPGGRCVAICANGPRQVEKLQPLATSWEELPAGIFAGTGVRAVLAVFDV